MQGRRQAQGHCKVVNYPGSKLLTLQIQSICIRNFAKRAGAGKVQTHPKRLGSFSVSHRMLGRLKVVGPNAIALSMLTGSKKVSVSRAVCSQDSSKARAASARVAPMLLG